MAVPDIETVTDHLYGVDRSDFVAERKVAARQARAAGAPELAVRIDALRKPTLAAWALDQVARRAPDVAADVAGLGAQIRSVMASGTAGAELRALLGRRGEVVARARDRALAVVVASDGSASANVAGQIEQTLRAAIASPAIAELLLAGRLVEPLTDVDLDVGLVSPEPRSEDDPQQLSEGRRRGSAASIGEGHDREPPDRHELRAAERAAQRAEREAAVLAERRDELERRVDDARAGLRRLEEQLAEVSEAHRDALQRRDDVDARMRAMTGTPLDELD